jgi:hypothetical protein
MTEKRPTPDETAGKSRRKSTAPTIDLKATEVKAGAAPVNPAAQESANELDKESIKSKPAEQESLAEPSKETRGPQESKPQPSEPQESQTQSSGPASEATSGAGHTGVAIAGGVAGALVTSLVLAGLWFAGIVSLNGGGWTAESSRVAALEKQIQELQTRPGQAGGNADALQARVAKMEDALKNLPAGDVGLSERVSAADNAMKSLGVALTALNHRNEEIAGKAAQAQQRADAAEKAVSDLRASVQDVSKAAGAGASAAELQPLQERVVALEQQTKAAQSQIARATASGKAARLALSAGALREAVARGAPFDDELAQAKSLGADERVLGPLMPFAATGVPNEKQLAAELRALLPALRKAYGSPAPSGGFIERLQANAEHLVRIRPVDAPPGNDLAAILARIEVEATHDDVAGALRDLATLPEKIRTPAQGWIAKTKNREAALAAARQFAADSARALGPR